MEAKVNNNIWKFTVNFLLKYSYILFPICLILIWWNWLAFSIGLFSLLSIIYNGYKKAIKTQEGHYDIKPSPKNVELLYYASVCGFLTLSFFTVMFGLLKLFDNSSDWETFLVIFYAFLVNCILFFITYLMKNRLNTGFLILGIFIFIVVDICAVFPFNFLFFYEKFQMNAEIDKKKIIATDIYKVLNKRNNDTIGKYEAIVRSDSASKIANAEDLDGTSKNQGKLNTLIADNPEDKSFYERLKRTEQRRVLNQNKKNQVSNEIFLSNKVIYNTAKSIEQDLNKAHNSFNDSIVKIKSPTIKLKLINVYFNTITQLQPLSESDTILIEKITKYNSEPKTQLTKVMDVYAFTWSKISGFENNNQDKEDEKLTILALTVSVLIDFLPLIICLFYIYFRRIE